MLVPKGKEKRKSTQGKVCTEKRVRERKIPKREPNVYFTSCSGSRLLGHSGTFR
jgi:hypothetical protein